MVTLKSSEQIKHIGEACRLTANLLDLLTDFIKAGMTTHEIDRYCYDFITKHGGKPAFLNYMGFPASACISVNEEVIHGIPGPRKIYEGDLVSVDLGINLNGYYSDAARTYIVGKTHKEWEKLVCITHQCLLEGIEGANKPGARIHDISKPIFNLANSHGFGVVRDYCGHGVGLAVHEDPQIPNYVNPLGANMRLRVGMVLAIEPMINLGTKNVRVLDDGWTVVTNDGKPSAHWEHTVAVTENGIEILTLAQ
ncbi:MAG: type I methionyl aminopeptidase [Sphaerochaetaceae bacterium]|jgi:methionyl aminopeptidase|nr:type I methionyl aminopeptidase [Sphaerochaetaceae bacterium]HHU88262.1 type I methionyl aminopeptidase [Spirochaetales bacterium]